jgi:hypothetical protein
MVLGHSSVAITERHYLPWVQARQVDLDESMRQMWGKWNKKSKSASVASFRCWLSAAMRDVYFLLDLDN